MAGVGASGGTGYGYQGPPNPFSQYGDPASFTAGAGTQASDYDTIMKNYGNIVNNANQSPISPTNVGQQNIAAPTNVTPQQVQGPASVNSGPGVTNPNVQAQTATYAPGADVTNSLSDLSNLATTGGYSAQNIADIRARDISPIRSIYANANQNVQRQRALSGGYSPNFNAATAQMARDASSQIADTTTNANAGIAQNVASNELAASGQYAGAAATENAARMQSAQRNADITNQINETNAARGVGVGEFNQQQGQQAQEFNVGEQQQNAGQNAQIVNQINEANVNRGLQTSENNANRATGIGEFNTQASVAAQEANRQAALSGTQGMASLYGTTPALTQTFGNQVSNATQLGQTQQQINEQKQRDLFNFAGGQ